MTSVLERIYNYIHGSLHRFVDQALENNSLALFDQEVRDMEAAIEHVEEAAAGMYAAARANERRLARHQEEVENLERLHQRLLQRGDESRAATVEQELAVQRDLVATTQAQIERQQRQYESLVRGRAEARVRAKALQGERPRLESLLVLVRAYRAIDRVNLTLDALRGMGGQPEVASIADSIYQRLHQAEIQQEKIRQADDLDVLEELERFEVADQLAERRQRLGLAEEPDQEEPKPAPAEPAESPPSRPEPPEADQDPPGLSTFE